MSSPTVQAVTPGDRLDSGTLSDRTDHLYRAARGPLRLTRGGRGPRPGDVRARAAPAKNAALRGGPRLPATGTPERVHFNATRRREATSDGAPARYARADRGLARRPATGSDRGEPATRGDHPVLIWVGRLSLRLRCLQRGCWIGERRARPRPQWRGRLPAPANYSGAAQRRPSDLA